MFLPLELIEKCVGSHIWVINKDHREFTALLKGFDDHLNLVLEEATEYERTEDGWNKTKLDYILLNSKSIALLVPGGEGPEVEQKPGGES
nr:LSm5 [Diplonema papillatum]